MDNSIIHQIHYSTNSIQPVLIKSREAIAFEYDSFSFGSVKKMDFAGERLNASVDGADSLRAKGAASCITVSLTKYICMTMGGFAPLYELLACNWGWIEHPQPRRLF